MLIESILYASIACLCQAPGEGIQAGGSPRPQGAERVLASFPLRAIAGESREVRAPLIGSFLGLDEAQATKSLMRERQGPRISIGEIAEIVRYHADPTGESQDFEIDLNEMSLVISGTPDQVAAGQKMMRFLESEVARAVRVTAAVYELPAEAQVGSLLAPGELERLSAGWKQLWSASSVVNAGESVVLAKERWTRYVGDIDAEVAQKSSISDPQCFRLFEGVRVVVQPHALVGDDALVVFSQFALGQRRGRINSMATSVRDQPSIQTPVSETNNACMSGRVLDGGALVFASRGASQAGSNFVLAVTTRFLQTASHRLGNTGVYPISSLVSKSLSRRVEPASDDGRPQIVPLVSKAVAKRPFGSFDRGRLEGVLNQALSDRLDVDEDVGLSIDGDVVIARGDDSFQTRVRAILQNLENKSLKTVLVNATTSAADPSPRDSGVWGDRMTQASATLWHQLSFPALLGRPHYAIRGIEQGTISDYNVEIAQAKAIANPVVDPQFSGLFVSLNAYAMSDGIAAEVQIELSHVAPLELRASEGSQGCNLYLPETSRVSLSHSGRITLDQAQLLGDGPKLALEGQSGRATRQRLEIKSH